MTEDAPQATDPSDADPSSRRTMGTVDRSFYLIGVGASAGGLEAIKQLIGQIPVNFRHSLCIIQHISPDYKSLMAEILARETSLTVREVADDMEVEARHIYLIPPSANVVIQGTMDDVRTITDIGSDRDDTRGLRFSLVPPSPRPKVNVPIDLFFHSLAEAVGDRAIAIVLSGTGTDGSRGLRAVKDRDGFVVVQDPQSATFDGMPRAAIATKIVDLIAPPSVMIEELERYFELREHGVPNIERLFMKEEREFRMLMERISESAHIDFSQYKEPTMKRRILRRMGLQHCKTVREYLDLVEEEPEELTIIQREFLVGVTNFFRDRPAWSDLEDRVLPQLFSTSSHGEPLKIWSVGCSTGEEAYTIALLLESYRRRHQIDRDYRVFATDVNAAAIQSAKQAVYPAAVIDEIPTEFRVSDYLQFHSGTFQLSQRIRSRVLFGVHNVLDDAPYIRTDLIICRNLLIYLSPDMQKRVMSLFGFSLRESGFLFLGAAEIVSRTEHGFTPFATASRIYRNSRDRSTAVPRPARDISNRTEALVPKARRIQVREGQRNAGEITELLTTTLSRVNAAILIVDETGGLQETFGDYLKFVQMPSEAFSSNLIDLAKDRLRGAILLALRSAEIDGEAHSPGILLEEEGTSMMVDVHCRRIQWGTRPASFEVSLMAIHATPPQATAVQSAPGEVEQGVRAYITKLETELETAQELLSVAAEDLGVSNEELQATNEELLTSNEELQANNEEMQSINEELHTVNAENAEKIIELENARADIENLLDNAELAIVFLDEELRIRRFSTSLSKYISLNKSDLGRSLETFSSPRWIGAVATLLDDAIHVRDTGKEVSRELKARDGATAFARIVPFRTFEGILDGVVISLFDLTEVRILQQEVQLQRDRLEGLLESEGAGYWDWNIPSGTEYLSPRFKSMFGYEDHELENVPESWQRIIHPDDLKLSLDNFEEHVKSKGKIPYDNEVRYFHKDGSVIWVICRGRVVEWADDGTPIRMMGVHVDITDLKERESRVLRGAEEVRRFSVIAAHDLLQPLNTIEAGVSALMEDLDHAMQGETADAAEFLTAATKRMKQQINGILEYARLQANVPLELASIDMTQVVKNCIEDLGSAIETDVTIDVGDLPSVRGATGLLYRVVLNLLSNAVKYRHKDRPCRIRVEAANAPSGLVGIRIVDNGIGIPEEHRAEVFKLLARLHAESEYEGNGLGLALAERLVSLHGGSIWIEDGDDGGCAFVFTLRPAT